ncbi:MAG: hypothetical protein KIT08_10170 [Anaerolineales bacterium]|nr:MAG: hypothetical protein KIT08_10170 [Anaerolineales bacterium]
MKRTLLLTLLPMLLVACGPSQAELDATLAAAQVHAVSTFAAQLTVAAEQNPSPTPTETPEPTATTEPTAEVQVTMTLSATGAATMDPCNIMVFREDVTVPDGEIIAGGATFTKTWNVENAGTCNWSPAYQLLFSHGDRMDGARTSQIQRTILAGDSGNISILLRAPTASGEYTGWWTLATPLGEGFGHLSVVIIVP